jgi:hypothetical protein
VNGVNIGRGGGNIATNTANGNAALISNTTGADNTASGYQALFSNTIGGYNTAYGVQALYNNTIGLYNTASGYQALFSNTTGSTNTGNGIQALYYNTTGAGNTANGVQALYNNTTGLYNTANGVQALYYNTTGLYNIGIGSQAGSANTTGSNNIFLGYNSTGESATESNRTWIGNTDTTSTWVGGNLLLGTRTNATSDKLQVTGSAKITGQLTLGSTITNGTYTYTLPSATGTLALTSDIHSAVTLSAIGSTPNANAATLTGQVLNLEPASASFGGVVTTGTQTFAGDKTLTGSLYGIGLSMTGTSGDIIGSVATSGKAIRGTATTGFGVYASATTGTAIYGESTGTGGAGINGTAGNGIGGYFLNNATGFATLYVTNNGSGNLANFSNSAGTKFTINNAGNLGNGTYTYTLPSATGTLALTSDLSAYLPLTGGTLTGSLTGTSATFSGNLKADLPQYTSGTNRIAAYNNTSARLEYYEAAQAEVAMGGPFLKLTGGTLTGALSGTSATFTGRIGTSLSSSGANFANSSLYVNNTANTKGAIFGYNDSADNFYFTALEYGVAYKPLLFNTSAATFSGIAVAQLFSGENSTSSSPVIQAWNKATSGDNKFIEFYVDGGGGTLRGSIDFNRASTLTRYNTTSDANLKNLIGDSNKQKSIDILNSTKIREFSWKADETNKPQIGVIAQELYETYKGAVSVGSDSELFDTEEYKNWQVDKTAFTFHLIAGWQKHEEIINDLKAQIEELKALIKPIEPIVPEVTPQTEPKSEPIIPTDNNLE